MYIPPLTQAEIDIQSGTLHAEDKDYKTAYSYYYEAFEQFSNLDDSRRVPGGEGRMQPRSCPSFLACPAAAVPPGSAAPAPQVPAPCPSCPQAGCPRSPVPVLPNPASAAQPCPCLRLQGSERAQVHAALQGHVGAGLGGPLHHPGQGTQPGEGTGIGTQSTRSSSSELFLSSRCHIQAGLKYAGLEVESMKAVAQAYQERSLHIFQDCLKQYRAQLVEDLLVSSHLSALYDTLLEQNLIRLIEPYSRSVGLGCRYAVCLSSLARALIRTSLCVRQGGGGAPRPVDTAAPGHRGGQAQPDDPGQGARGDHRPGGR